jgi:hypothetical protein
MTTSEARVAIGSSFAIETLASADNGPIISQSSPSIHEEVAGI